MGKLIEAVKCADIISEKFNIPLVDLVDVFAEIPTADVVEVKHSAWNFMGTEMFTDGSYCSSFCCPSCYREVRVCHEHKQEGYRFAKLMYPYCHCGADMRGDAE